METLTTQTTWSNYWKNHRKHHAHKKPFYQSYLPQLLDGSSLIEIGGFPGLNMAYFYHSPLMPCTTYAILDFCMDEQIVRQIEEDNQLPAGTIQTITADFLAYESDRQYDLVFSMGFIEHFQDTRDIIRRHVNMLKEGGNLLIILPNFRGLNGWIQRWFDSENMTIHNINCMNKALLRSYCEDLGLKEVHVFYARKPMVWLEPKGGTLNKIVRPLVKLLSYVLKVFPIPCKLLSPFIIIKARK